jgi:hypothetical protein
MHWSEFPPHRTHRGGTPAPQEIVGRDAIVACLWHLLEHENILLTAQRRLGKSSLLILMKNAPPKDTLVLKRDLENVRTPIEFVERILEDITQYLSTQKRAGEWCRKLLQEMGGTEIRGIVKLPSTQELNWKTHLEGIMSDLMLHESRRVVFLWDEIPLMLDNIRQQSGEQTAMDVLDTLRALRQKYIQLRMVFTGSVGLHHVLGALQSAGHGNASTNDMFFLDLPALSREDAMGLAWSLICGERLKVVESDVEGVVSRIADSMDCLPFYIHHLVGRLTNSDQMVTQEEVNKTVEALLRDPHDPCGMRNYQARIKKHYLPEHRPIAYALLDQLAVANETLPFDDLFNRLKHRLTIEDEEIVREVLYLLESDHYVLLGLDNGYSFRFPIIARAWKIQRGIRA